MKQTKLNTGVVITYDKKGNIKTLKTPYDNMEVDTKKPIKIKRVLKVYENGEEINSINCYSLKFAIEQKEEIKAKLSDYEKKITKFRIVKPI